jgi:hypothetical protein
MRAAAWIAWARGSLRVAVKLGSVFSSGLGLWEVKGREQLSVKVGAI